MVREVASKTNDLAGDGTTTATVLAQAIVREGAKYVAAGINPMDLKRGIDLATAAAVKDIIARAKKVSTSDEVAQVGTISANGDKEIGEMIAHAMQKVGNEGVITVEESNTFGLEIDLVDEDGGAPAVAAAAILRSDGIAAEVLRAARVRVAAGRASPLEEQRADVARARRDRVEGLQEVTDVGQLAPHSFIASSTGLRLLPRSVSS